MMRFCTALALLLKATSAFSFGAPPNVTHLFPSGAKRGTTVEVTAGGTFERWPVKGWASDKGITVTPGKEKGVLSVAVAAEVAPGTHWIRLHDEEGASGLRPFLVGTLPEVAEQEPNDEAIRPQMLASLPVVVNGRLAKVGDVDCFAMKLTKGQTLVASVEANQRLGSPMDGIVQVLSERGSVLTENNDCHGLDPQVTYQAPADGTVVVRVFAFPAIPDATIRFAGGETFVYRLTLTTSGFVEYAFPTAVSRAAPGAVERIGWNIPEALRHVEVARTEADFVDLFHADLAGSAVARVEPHATLVEMEPNDREHPQAITLPVTISGRINPRGDVDVFQFEAKKGQAVVFALEGPSLGSPLDPLLLLRDEAGKVRTRANDPAGKDTTLSFTPPQDGKYRVEVRDLHGDGGSSYFYRLRCLRPQPNFALSIAADRYGVEPGKPTKVPVIVEKQNGFTGDVELVVVGLPEGMSVPAAVAKGGGKVTVELMIEAKANAVAGDVRIVGRAKLPGDVERVARTAAPGVGAFVPHVWLSVGKAGPPPPPKKKK
jgi:hypothetical protein